jgi:hypothetical protein
MTRARISAITASITPPTMAPTPILLLVDVEPIEDGEAGSDVDEDPTVIGTGRIAFRDEAEYVFLKLSARPLVAKHEAGVVTLAFPSVL